MVARLKNSQGAATKSASEQAYDRIFDLILMRELRPGERTSVNLLADRLGLGKTPIKEAITRLDTEGVLTVTGRSGTTVNNINAEQARQLFALRRTFEEFAADEIVRNITKQDIKKLNRLLVQLRDSSFSSADFIKSGADFVRANVAFHSTIIAAAGNPFLDRLYSQIQIQAQIVTYLVHHGYNIQAAKKRQQEHEAVVAALEARNSKMLKKTLREHAETSESAILSSLEAWAQDDSQRPAVRRSASSV